MRLYISNKCLKVLGVISEEKQPMPGQKRASLLFQCLRTNYLLTTSCQAAPIAKPVSVCRLCCQRPSQQAGSFVRLRDR